jgi:hypothetical protein
MSLNVIADLSFPQPAGFTQNQFRQLDQIYSTAASQKALTYRTIECDFDEGTVSYTYYMSEHNPPYLQFVIRKVGPRATMFELYKQGRGRLFKSGLFERTVETLRDEVSLLLNNIH